MRRILEVPEGFSFRRTVLSHGWYELDPFRWDAGEAILTTTVALPRGAVSVRMAAAGSGVTLRAAGARDAASRVAVESAARRMLQLDLDLREFHAVVSAEKPLRWIADQGVGRLLRAPTVFEDLIKLVLTTNCSWSLTKGMVGNLVARYGEPAADGSRAFPGVGRLAELSEREWRERIRAGYRSPSLVRLCRSVAAGEVDPEEWPRSRLEPPDLKKVMLALPGVGPYVAESLLKLLGRPHGLGLDSWMRARYADRFHAGRRVSDRTIARRLAPLGPWAGLALWFELADGPAS